MGVFSYGIILNMKEWSTWLKITGTISLVLIIADIFIVWIPCFPRICHDLVTDIILLPILGIILGCWVVGFLVSRKLLGSSVLIVGSVISGAVVFLTLSEYVGIRGFDFRGWFPLPFSLFIFLFLIVSAIINSRK